MHHDSTIPRVNPLREQQVVVFGATGFIGRHVVAALLEHGWRVRAFVHVAETVPFDAGSRMEVVRGDVRDPAAVQRAVAGCAGIVNAAGLKRDEPESADVNVGGARNLIAASREAGGIRIIQISTQAVKLARQGTYARTKLAADRVLEQSGLPVTLLRPSVVYGSGISGVFSTMQRAVERWPVVPVFGDGRWGCAPVHVADVAEAVAACLAKAETIGRTYDLGGPDVVSLDDLLDRIAGHLGRRCRRIHIPFPLALLLTRMLVRLWPQAPVTVSNVLGSNQPIAIDSTPARREFGFEPRGLERGIRDVLGERVGEAASADGALADEARLFAHHLLGVALSPSLVERYRQAIGTGRFGSEDGVLRFVRKHPWSLPLLDGAEAVRARATPLRQRLHLMAALLETTPEHASWYFAPTPSRSRLWIGLAWRGITGVMAIGIGMVLRPLIR